MTLIEADPQSTVDELAGPGRAPGAAVIGEPEPLDGAPLPADGLLAPGPDDVPEASGEPRCRACGTALADGQDWCLECGTATTSPRRLPGLRAIGLATVLTLALAGGAVAASYAALTDEAPERETKVKTLAQTTPLPTTTTPDDVEPLPPADDVEPLPPADDLTTDLGDAVTPIDPAPADDIVTPVPSPTDDSDTDSDSGSEPEPEPKPGTVKVVLASGAGSLYDPDARAAATGDPQRAIDGSLGTSWFVTTPAGADMNTGYLLDLGEQTVLRRLELFTKTPGFSVQVFGARGQDPPPSIGDAGWTKLGEAGSVDAEPAAGTSPPLPRVEGDKAGDDRVGIALDRQGKTYRQVLLWITAPPKAAPTARFSEIRLFT